MRASLCAFALLVVLLLSVRSLAQEGFGQRAPDFASVEVSSEGKIRFRIYAPRAQAVRLSSSDIPGLPQAGLEMTKQSNGVWEVETPSVHGGAYRYNFSVDGLAVIDPRNSATSESNGNTWSLVTVPGSPFSDLRNVPHGAVARVTYYSATLDRFRRLHVYTPPGYESSSESYPVLYLLHGAFDCDNSWSTVGQANQILDNLIAEGKAQPMIVVMPMGHTGPFSFGPGGGFERQMGEFVRDFRNEIRPEIEGRYRTKADRAHRAIAGLSMGGAQTLDIALSELADFAYVGVFSSGVFGIERGGPTSGTRRDWEVRFAKTLADAELKKGLRLLWFATGRDDFLVGTTRATVDALKSHGFEVTYRETDGGHTWTNWRDYLNEFAPLLFVDGPGRDQKTQSEVN